MRYDWNRNRYGRINRYLGWLITAMAVVSWPLFASDAFRERDWTIILAALIVTGPVVLQRIGVRKVYGIHEPAPAEVEPEPEPRTPRDLDRPYPRPAGGRRKPDKTCPVCGTGPETTALDGRVLGWRAHGSCAEWLGEHWRPARPVPPPYKPDMELIGHIERGGYGAGNLTASELPPPPSSVSVHSSTNTVRYAGGTALTIGLLTGGAGGSSNLDSMALTNDVAAVIRRQIADGQVSVEEARERIISAFGVPGPALGDAVDEGALGHLVALQEMFLDSEMRATAKAIEQRCKVPGKPAITEFCTCGMKFTGTPEWIRRELDAHRASGAHRTA